MAVLDRDAPGDVSLRPTNKRFPDVAGQNAGSGT